MKVDTVILLVSTLVTLISILTPFISRNLKFVNISIPRKKALVGKWVGTTHQAQGPDGVPITVSLETQITTSWRRIKTRTTLTGGGIVVQSIGIGGFLYGEYLLLTYRSKSKAIVNFGATLLRFHSDGETLSGKTIGFGAKSERMIQGEVTLKRA